MGHKDYYAVLGVKKDATGAELKSAYRKLSLATHPDRQAGKSDAEKKAAEEKFKEVNEAYSVLSDREKRERYDRFGTADPQEGGFSGFGDGFDPMGFFRKMHAGFGMGGFGFDFEEATRGGRSPTDAFSAPEDGADVQIQRMRVSFRESVFGCEKEFDLNLDKECPSCGGRGCAKGSELRECGHCHGRGQVVKSVSRGWMMSSVITPCPHCRGTGVEYDPCPDCGGTGRVPAKRHVKVKVPAGVADGATLRLSGSGKCGIRGGRNGSLFIPVQVQPSEVFERDGFDIYVKAYVSPATATLGGKVEVPTLEGYRKIKLKPGIASGTMMRVAGAGVKPDGRAAGDMIVEVLVEPYASPTKEQKELLEKLAATEKDGTFARASEQRKAADGFYAS